MWEWLTIVISSLILEDPTTLLVSTQVHDGRISWWLGGSALFFGIMIGDLGLYTIGYLTRIGVIKKDLSHLDHPVTAWTVFAARFAPGLRVIIYTTSGFFKYPVIPFAFINAVSGLIWSVLLIALGQQIFKYLGWWGVGGVVSALILLQIYRRWKKSSNL